MAARSTTDPRRRQRSPALDVVPLEGRTLLSTVHTQVVGKPTAFVSLATQPAILDVGLRGASGKITGIVVRFSQDVDPKRAEDLGNYLLEINRGGAYRQVDLTLASYDAATRTVRLATSTPFSLNAVRKVRISVQGAAPGGLTAPGGRLLDLNGDGTPGETAVFTDTVSHGHSVRYRDADGDIVTFRLVGPGRIDLVRRADGEAEQLWLNGTAAQRSVLTGSISPRRGSGGTTSLQELVGVASADVSSVLLGTPSHPNGPFHIARVTNGPQADQL